MDTGSSSARLRAMEEEVNFGDCPYDDCSGTIWLSVPERTPTYVEIDCEKCHRPIWYKLSRVEPIAWTKEDFEREFVVDRDARTIVKRKANAETQ